MQKQQIKDQNNSQETVYIFQHPFRAVLPYNYQYQTFAKARWYEKPLLQTLVKQFKAYDEQYYKKSIENGNIKMNGKIVDINYIIKNGDKLVHQAIRQEPPILDLQIEIIFDNQQYLVVNKPSSFTVHTGGGFHYNTLAKILQIQKGYKNLYILHRLDRLTSGLIIFGKTKQKPQIFHKENQNKQLKKMYFARVSGNFTWSQKNLCAQIQCISHKDGIYKVSKEIIIKDELLKQQLQLISQPKLNQQKKLDLKTDQIYKNKKKKKQQKKNANPDIKQSMTYFKKIFYDQKSDSSLVQCYPISGRTHQIRVHLQFLQFPILNDVVYGGRFVGNHIINFQKKLKEQKIINKDLQISIKQILNEQNNYGKKKVKTQQNACTNKQILQMQTQIKEIPNLSKQKLQNKKQEIKKYIEKLKSIWDYKTKPWQICLHSFQYKLQGNVFTTSKPYWANINFNFDIQ